MPRPIPLHLPVNGEILTAATADRFSNELIHPPLVSLVQRKTLGRAVEMHGFETVNGTIEGLANELMDSITIKLGRAKLIKQASGTRRQADRHCVMLSLLDGNDDLYNYMNTVVERLGLSDQPGYAVHFPTVMMAETIDHIQGRSIEEAIGKKSEFEIICGATIPTKLRF